MNKKDIFLIIFFVFLGVITRTILHIAPNVEFITAISLSSAIFLKNKKLALVVPLSSLFLSDLIIGNSSIYIFTWSGFLIAFVMGLVLNSSRFFKIKNLATKALLVEGTGVLGTLTFFFWTNFGVVVVSNMYPKTLAGITQSYINGLPFLTTQLIANLIIVPSVFLITYFLLNRNFFPSRSKKLA